MEEVDIRKIIKLLLAENLTQEQRDLILDVILGLANEVLEAREVRQATTPNGAPKIPSKAPAWPVTVPIEPEGWDPNKTGITWVAGPDDTITVSVKPTWKIKKNG